MVLFKVNNNMNKLNLLPLLLIEAKTTFRFIYILVEKTIVVNFNLLIVVCNTIYKLVKNI